MIDRTAQIDQFLSGTDWAAADHSNLAGDASNRRYLRLYRSGQAPQTAVLMDAPADKGEDVRPFVYIAEHLTHLGLSAPKIYAQDSVAGLLLLEDLGDDLFARVLEKNQGMENSLYSSAIDVLAHLHRFKVPNTLARYDADTAAELSALVFDWYSPKAANSTMSRGRSDFVSLMRATLDTHAPEQDVLIQRDYHSENLLWLPNRDGLARVGLLDFQDAMAGHRAYDLVSLLQDARRDVAPEVEEAMIRKYCDLTDQNPEEFRKSYATLGVQRNLRILGVFARLCIRDGKAHYIDFIPRVWSLLLRDLTHPALADLQDLLIQFLPHPSPKALESLKSKCATHRAQ